MNKPHCKLTDGNVFSIIGAVGRALQTAGQKDKAVEWKHKALNADSYGAVIMLASEYVEID